MGYPDNPDMIVHALLTGHLLAVKIRKWRSQPLLSPYSTCKQQPYHAVLTTATNSLKCCLPEKLAS